MAQNTGRENEMIQAQNEVLILYSNAKTLSWDVLI